ncbi:MAG: T9SS type A sorting domain-containing protein [Flavobacteriales bacterium]
MGERFALLKNGDTALYRLSFNRSDRYNSIVKMPEQDTVFYGTVSKYKGLYFLNERRPNARFWIGAIEIEKGLFQGTPKIHGLGTLREQMHHLEEKVRAGKLNHLVKEGHGSEEKILLRPEESSLYQVYSSILDSIPPDTLVDTDESSVPSDDGKEKLFPDKKEASIVKKFYPNPAREECHLVMREKGSWNYLLVDMQGKKKREASFEGERTRIDISHLKAGTYVLRIWDRKGKKKEERLKLIKKGP